MTLSSEPDPSGRLATVATLRERPLPGIAANGPLAVPRRLRLAAETARSLGPVADLESRVPANWWQQIFDGLYLKTDGDVFENDANTRADVEALIAAAEIDTGDRVLDLCCGQGRHVLELARRGFRDVTGIDASHYLIELARQRACAADVGVKFLEGDARQCGLSEGRFDCVAILGNSFGYFERAEEDAALLRNAKRLLRPGGRLALDLVDGDWLRSNYEKRS